MLICNQRINAIPREHSRIQSPDSPFRRVQRTREAHKKLVRQLQRRDAGCTVCRGRGILNGKDQVIDTFHQRCAEKEPTGLDIGDAICEGSNGIDNLRGQGGAEVSTVAILVASVKRILADGQA